MKLFLATILSTVVAAMHGDNIQKQQGGLRGEGPEPAEMDLATPGHRLLQQASNGQQCAENDQCSSGCCSQYWFGADTCQQDRWWRNCVEGHDFQAGTNGQCAASSSSSDEVKLMSYNIYMIILASDILSIDERIAEIVNWFENEGGDLDIVVIQESWLYPDTLKNGMSAAGYCHYTYDDRGTFGSGLAIYSKFPIAKHDFRAFAHECDDQDCVVDKGVIYAEIDKNGTPIHVFGTHTMSAVANHEIRLGQYDVMRSFINEKDTSTGHVFMMGDFNEDKITTPAFYSAMLTSLDAGEIQMVGSPYSYDPVENSLLDPDSPGAGLEREALDFVFYDETNGRQYADSECEYWKPKNAAGEDISDHYPIVCQVGL
jgi:endonuclease/exonuclease/phosphatase family metal-dependent hydrolase